MLVVLLRKPAMATETEPISRVWHGEGFCPRGKPASPMQPVNAFCADKNPTRGPPDPAVRARPGQLKSTTVVDGVDWAYFLIASRRIEPVLSRQGPVSALVNDDRYSGALALAARTPKGDLLNPGPRSNRRFSRGLLPLLLGRTQ
ncbi:hypothetical protein KC356_g26 [Hortaea werneckii]|nr:hypothetical protein KC356_g26 [Hortaea werneckii]